MWSISKEGILQKKKIYNTDKQFEIYGHKFTLYEFCRDMMILLIICLGYKESQLSNILIM